MNLFENLQVMNESEEIKTFNISFKRNNVYQANLIKGYSEDQVVNYFKEYKPDAEILGVKVATKDDEKPGKPVIDSTKDSLKEGLEDPKSSLQDKADKFGTMINALGEEMSAREVNEFLKSLTDELDMDIYEDGEPYPCDLDGYFGQPVDELDLNDKSDAELFDWVDNILTNCIDKTKSYIENKIETLKGEISALETTIKDLESTL